MKINTLTTKDKLFQQRLYQLADPPKRVYYMGQLFDPQNPAIAIVGSRKPTHYGEEMTYKLAYDLAKRGITIVSGLAIGVDGIAHTAALDAGGNTIAVMAGGLNEIYPRRHASLAQRILAHNGALMSEYDAAMPCLPHQFIARNRIIAALADATLVTEAATKSGSLHTAQFALELGKPVMAVPGLVTNPMASGCLNLLKSGAELVTNVDDILFGLGYVQATQQQLPLIANSAEEQLILQLLQQGTGEGELLLAQSKLSASLFNQALTMLEINGQIRALGGNNWILA